MRADQQRRARELRRWSSASWAALALLLGSACSGSGPSELAACDTVMPAATLADVPTFSWVPSHCGIYLLTVTHDSAGTAVTDWLVEGDGNSIRPPVKYGLRPATALPFCGLFCPLEPATPLHAGRTYTVSLGVEIPHSQGGPIIQLSGSTTFVP